MRKTKSFGNEDGILLDRTALYSYVNAGRTTADRIAKEACARRVFGKTVRYYRPAIDAYLEKLGTSNRG